MGHFCVQLKHRTRQAFLGSQNYTELFITDITWPLQLQTSLAKLEDFATQNYENV